MSRYIVTSDSYFRPFSYDEMVKPLQQMTDAHNAAADAYDQLSLETEALRNYISENEDDKQAKAMYDNYINKLHTLQDNLWNRGYNTGTRRDLSAARAAYASDITRLQKAVQTRQERSKEYWDARHKNPELVTGFDPGMSGLDNYLSDDRYGQNWFSYSGTQFANEVASEAKARANELLSSVVAGSEAPGYLRYIQKNGFTNQQVNDAGVLASRALSGDVDLDTLPDSAEKLLASVLVSRLQSTGANPSAGGNLSSSEYGRLFNYGMLGLSQGVGEMNEKMIDDKVWEQQQKYALAAYQHSLSNPAPTTTQNGYALDGTPIYTENPDYDEKNTFYNKNVHNYSESPLIVTANGVQSIIENEDQANALFEKLGKSEIERKYGIDPESQIRGRHAAEDKRIEVERTLSDGRKVLLRYVPMTNKQKKDYASDVFMREDDGYKYEPVAVEQRINGEWKINDEMTKRFNRDNRSYQQRRDAIKIVDKDGKKVELDKIALVGETKKAIYKKGDINANVPTQFAQAVYDIKNRQGTITPAIIADSSMPQAVLDYYTGKFQEKYAGQNLGKGIDKSSRFAFYIPKEGGIGYEEKGETTPDAMFNSKGSNDNKSVDYGIVAIGATPEDVYNYGKIRVTTNKGKVRGVDPEYAGNYIAGTFDAMRAPITQDEKGIIHYMMLPISDPERVAMMSLAEQQQWVNVVGSALRQYMDFNVRDASGNVIGTVGPQQILTNNQYLDALRNNVIRYMNTQFSLPRDFINQNHMQVTGESSTKASPYVTINR